MRSKVKLSWLTTFVFFTLCGCANVRHASDSMGKWNPDELMPSLGKPVDIISLLSEGTRRTPPAAEKGKDPESGFDEIFQNELVIFSKLDPAEQKRRRNLVQDRLKTSSDELCDQYKSNVLRKQARANFWLGTTSLFLGSAGALAKGVDTARALSGGAAFFTGVRSEYNQDYFLDQTITVIAKSIEKRQQEIALEVNVKRDNDSSTYSVLQAINDIGRYHHACSLVAALSFADKAVTSYNISRSVQDAAEAQIAFRRLIDANNTPRAVTPSQ